MKKRLLSLAILTASSTALATNGDNMIGVGAITRAMGGTGTALAVGTESALKNPALMQVEGDLEVDFAATAFMPKVTAENTSMAGFGGEEQTSASDMYPIPAIGLMYKINEKMVFGVGAWGVAGLGVDYRDADAVDGLSQMSTSLSLFKFAPSLKYQVNDNFSVGVGLHMLQGTLAISYDQTADDSQDTGRGASQSIGTGFDLGLAYKLGAMTFGFNYQTQIAMEYKHQLANAAGDFQASSELDSDKLTQPSEMALGFTYDAGDWLVTVDYRTIGWSSAAGYEEFGWEDQTVIALGGAYTMGKNIFRLGYSSANNPLGDDAVKNSTSTARGSFNFLNAVGFPATITSHMSLGYTREFSKRFSLDLAYVMANGDGDDISFMSPGGENSVKSTHSQSSFTVGGRWVF